MTRKQRERLARNRESQRMAFAEHARIAREFGVASIEGTPRIREMASRRISGISQFNAHHNFHRRMKTHVFLPPTGGSSNDIPTRLRS